MFQESASGRGTPRNPRGTPAEPPRNPTEPPRNPPRNPRGTPRGTPAEPPRNPPGHDRQIIAIGSAFSEKLGNTHFGMMRLDDASLRPSCGALAEPTWNPVEPPPEPHGPPPRTPHGASQEPRRAPLNIDPPCGPTISRVPTTSVTNKAEWSSFQITSPLPQPSLIPTDAWTATPHTPHLVHT